MSSLKDLSERYKNYSNHQLLEILNSPSHYQNIALQAATLEWNSRNLTESEIEEAENRIKRKNDIDREKDEATDLLISKVNNAGKGIYDTLNPINNTTPTASKIIALIVIGYAILLIASLGSQWDLLILYIDEEPFDTYYFIITILPLVFLFVSIVSFAFRKKIGWMLLLSYCSFSFSGVFYSIYLYISSVFSEDSYFIFASPSPSAIILGALLYVGTILALLKPDVMNAYKVSKQNFQNSLVAGIVAGILFSLIVLL